MRLVNCQLNGSQCVHVLIEEAPNLKLQAPEKHQIPNSKPLPSHTRRCGAWSLAGLWRLVFGVWSFFALPAHAQTAPQPQDPLMSLMMSQPPVGLTSPVTPSATFDPPVVRPGEQTMYRVTFNALEESIAWPEQIAAPSELDMRPGARGQILQM